jgi:hypothetical protein
MGLLDDAIREHLDLKRRRGADPTEVERAEKEALGPVRRHPEHAEELRFDREDALDEEGLAYDDELQHEWEEAAGHPPAAETGDGPGYPLHAADVADPYEAAREEQQFVDEAPRAGGPAARDVPPVEPPPTSAPPNSAEQAGPETAEYQVEFDHPGEEHHPGQEQHPGEERREDMLEGTPEFLQDTPDHDRLWFEQRPPRDFNFDS